MARSRYIWMLNRIVQKQATDRLHHFLLEQTKHTHSGKVMIIVKSFVDCCCRLFFNFSSRANNNNKRLTHDRTPTSNNHYLRLCACHVLLSVSSLVSNSSLPQQCAPTCQRKQQQHNRSCHLPRTQLAQDKLTGTALSTSCLKEPRLAMTALSKPPD